MAAHPDGVGARWVAVCRVGDVPDADALALATTPRTAIFGSNGELFCIDDTCSHEDYPLSDGWVEDCRVECALHSAKFDLRTGAPLGAPATAPVRTHRVRVDGGVVHVELPEGYRFGPSGLATE